MTFARFANGIIYRSVAQSVTEWALSRHCICRCTLVHVPLSQRRLTLAPLTGAESRIQGYAPSIQIPKDSSHNKSPLKSASLTMTQRLRIRVVLLRAPRHIVYGCSWREVHTGATLRHRGVRCSCRTKPLSDVALGRA